MLDRYGHGQRLIDLESKLNEEAKRSIEKIRTTAQELEALAIKHGAELPVPRILEWTGHCKQEGMPKYSMLMTMSLGPDGKIAGTLEWPESNITKFEGEISKDKVSFVETQILSGSGIGIPCHYEATISGDVMRGTGDYQGHKTSFEIQLSSGNREVLK